MERRGKLVPVLGKDAIRSIDEPHFLPAVRADGQMRPDEPVIGLAINREARAYPTYVLSRHEIVNDRVGGQAVAVTW